MLVFACPFLLDKNLVLIIVQGGEPKIALSFYNRQQSQVQFLVPHPVCGIATHAKFTPHGLKYVPLYVGPG